MHFSAKHTQFMQISFSHIFVGLSQHRVSFYGNLLQLSFPCTIELVTFQNRLKSFLIKHFFLIQVNLCQMHSFLNQLTHNMTTDCSLVYNFLPRKIQIQNVLLYKNCFECQNNKNKKQFLYTTCSELVFFLYCSRKSMKNLLSYCGLTDSRMSASDTDLPVSKKKCLIKKDFNLF